MMNDNEKMPETEAILTHENITDHENVQSSENILNQGTTSREENPEQAYSTYQVTDCAIQASQAESSETAKSKKTKKVKKAPKANGGMYFKKVMAAASLGIFFGLCAGLGLYAVSQMTDNFGRGHDSIMTMNHDQRPEGQLKVADKNTNKEIVETKLVSTVTTDVSDVVEEVMPAMVSVINTYEEKMSYFGQVFSQEGEASGSGIIVGENEDELLIVTNYHVVAESTGLTVGFIDGTTAEAQVKGSEPGMDLAVISIPLDSLSSETKQAIAVAKLGDSDNLRMGEPAIAIGNALGYGQSVTTGVMSALDREIELSDGTKGTFIQTNAAINPGNSGGALLNLNGEVVGINSNKIGGATIEGMGYAIPISAARPIIEELMLKETRNKVAEQNKGYLGITPVTVTPEVVELYDMPQGVYIAKVYEGTGAEAAGLVKGDIITKLDDYTIRSYEDLQNALQYYSAGETVELTIMQGSPTGYQEKQVMLTLGKRIESE